MIRCRFYLNKEDVNNDYRPAIWPIKYPYWCTGESDNNFSIVAYFDSLDDLVKQWPEAHTIETENVYKIKFNDRFPKPDWYK